MSGTKKVVLSKGIVRFPIAHILFPWGTSWHPSSLVSVGVWGTPDYVLMWKLGPPRLQESLKLARGGAAGACSDQLLPENIFHLWGNSFKQHRVPWWLCLVSVLNMSSACHPSLLWEPRLWQVGLVLQALVEARIKSTTRLRRQKEWGGL